MKMSSQYRASAVGIRDYSYYSSPAFSVPVSSVQSNRLKPALRSTVSVVMPLRRRNSKGIAKGHSVVSPCFPHSWSWLG